MLADPARCIARYAYDSGLLDAAGDSLTVQGHAFDVDMLDSRNVMVCLGPPGRHAEGESIAESLTEAPTLSVIAGEREWTYTPVYFLGPHAVLFLPGIPADLGELCKRLPGVRGVHVCRVFSRTEVEVRSFHDVASEEPSSGEGTAAAVVAAVVNGLADREVVVHTRGGELMVDWDEASDRLFETAPVDYVFSGIYTPPDPV
jgi:diaminopimelate epimerase